jgi:hypothetical protein
MLNKNKIAAGFMLLQFLLFVPLFAQNPVPKTPDKKVADSITQAIGEELNEMANKSDDEKELAELMRGNNDISGYKLQDLPDMSAIFPALSYLEDKEGTLTIQQIVGSAASKFVPYGNDFRVAHDDTKTYWLKLTLLRDANLTTDWVFMFDRNIDLIELYTQQGADFVKTAQTGGEIAYKERTLALSDMYANYLPIKVYDKPLTCYLKIVCNPHLVAGFVPISPNILKYSDLASISLDRYYPQGIYFGAMLLLILFNLGIFSLYQDKAKVWFIGSLVVTTCYQLALRGFFEKLFSLNIFAPLQQYFSFVFGCLAIMLFAQFSRLFLKSREFMPILDKILAVLIGFAAILMFTGLIIAYNTMNQVLNYLNPFSLLLLLVVAFIGIKREYEPAKFLFIGLIITLVGSFLYALTDSSLLEPNFFTNNSIQIGEVFRSLLITVGLVARLQRKNIGGKVIN